jgi:Ca2+-binding EF-hand superfamily protein
MFSATSAHAIVLEALESDRSSKALARRLWLSFVRTDAEVLYKQDLIDVLGPEHKDEVEEIFAHLDKDGNGDVSLDEMTMLVVNAAQDRKNRTNSMKDISHAISVLDRLLSIVVLIGECQYTPRRKVLS